MKLSYRRHTLRVPLRLMLLLRRRMQYVRAAGGVVTDAGGQRLLMTRHGRADLPKGMVEPGETLVQAALREVHEETGIRCRPTSPTPLLKTYHIYNLYGGWHLKQTTWFGMAPAASGDTLAPQREEGITQVGWHSPGEWRQRLRRSFGTLRTLARVVPMLAMMIVGTRAVAQQPWEWVQPTAYTVSEAYLAEPSTQVKAALGKAAPRFNCRYYVAGPDRGRFRLTNADTTFALTAEQMALVAPSMVAVDYWEGRFARLLDWQYLDAGRAGQLVDLDTTRLHLGRYTPLRFLAYSFQPSTEWPVVFTVLTNNHRPQTLSLAALGRLAEWGAFATDADMLRHEEHLDALAADSAMRQAEQDRTLDSLDAIIRRAMHHADSLSAELAADSATAADEQMRRDVESAKQRMKRDQIFVMNIKPAQSEYMFGLEFNLYNCFSKIITKVEITVLPCNRKGQVQADKFGRSERTVRCMGPIRPDAPAQYTFDELFWDDSHRIAYLRTTSITLHFTDGTRRTFSGAENIRRHSLSK